MVKVSKRTRLACVAVAALSSTIMSSRAWAVPAYNNLAQNPNQRAVAGLTATTGLQGLVGVPNAASAIARIDNMSAADARSLFDQVSPEAYGAYALALQEQGNLFTHQVAHRLAGGRSGEDARMAVWGNLYGQWGNGKGSAFRHGSDQDIFGGTIGVDSMMGADLTLGVAAGYSEDKVRYRLGNSKGKSRSWEIGGYAGYHPGRLRADFQIAYIDGNIDARKSVNVGTGLSAIAGVATANTDGSLLKLVGTIGYRLGGEHISFTPFVGIDFASGKLKGFNEHGTMGALAMHVDAIKADRTDLLAGFNFEPHIGRVTPYADATVRYHLNRSSGNFRAYFDGIPSDAFVISAQRSYMMQAELDAGLSFAIGKNSSIFFGYAGTLRKNVGEKRARTVSTNGANGGVKLAF